MRRGPRVPTKKSPPSALGGPGICLLPQQGLDGRDLLPASSLFPSRPLRDHLRPSSETSRPWFLPLTPPGGITVSSHMRQNYSTPAEAAVSRLVSVSGGLLHLPVSRLPCQLGPCCSAAWARKKHEGAKCLLKWRNQHGGHIVFQEVLKLCQDEGVTLRMCGSHHGLGEASEPGPCGCAGPGPYLHRPPSSVTSWRTTSGASR